MEDIWNISWKECRIGDENIRFCNSGWMSRRSFAQSANRGQLAETRLTWICSQMNIEIRDELIDSPQKFKLRATAEIV